MASEYRVENQKMAPRAPAVLHRREVLLAGLATCGPIPTSRAAPFPWGVTTADPTPTSVTLATQLAPGDTAELVVSLERQRVSRRRLTADADGYLRATLDGLSPGTRYAYQLEAGGTAFDGRFKTAPASDWLGPLTFGATSCLRQTRPLDVLQRAAELENLDAFFLVGDSVYADGAVTLAEYRAKWREGLSQPPSIALRAAHAVVGTWDDHEIRNDASKDNTPAAQLDAARRALLEHLAIRTNDEQRLWRSLRFGRTAEVLVLDCRGERRPEKKEYLSREQLDWLKGRLVESDCRFKLIVNSVPIGAFPDVGFQIFAPDRWEGFPAQRTELLEHLDARKVSGALFVSGDFHLGAVGRVATDGLGANVIEALVGPGSSAPNPALAGVGPPQWDFVTGQNTFSTLRLDPATLTTTVDYRDTRGEVLFSKAYALGRS